MRHLLMREQLVPPVHAAVGDVPGMHRCTRVHAEEGMGEGMAPRNNLATISQTS